MIGTVKEIARAVKGMITQSRKNQEFHRVSIDSRSVKTGDIFFAIQGHRLDGHQFVRAAVRQGAGAVVVAKSVRSVPRDVSVINVDDTTKALGRLAAAHRRKFSIPVIAVTGSAGKTTTKELVAQVLAARYRVLKNTGSFNNFIGVPLTLFQLTKQHQMAVLELGTNQPGDIAWLTSIVHPTFTVLTNIGEAHLEKLKSPAKVFQEKIQVLKGMDKGGKILINSDDPWLRKLLSRVWKDRILTYGIKGDADFRAEKVLLGRGQQIQFRIDGQKFELNTPVEANVYNALAAISCGRVFRVGYQTIRRQLKTFDFDCSRQTIKSIGGVMVIDDVYNANPVSFRSALKTLAAWPTRKKRILVAADMLELGEWSGPSHLAMGTLAADLGIRQILTFGTNSRLISEGAVRRNPAVLVEHFSDRLQLHRRLAKVCQPEDVLLVKGSRAMQMEKTVVFLTKHFSKD